MSDVHSIRLRGPWQFEVLECFGRADEEPAQVASGKMLLPADWGEALGARFCGRVRFRRRFGRPTSLLPGDEVFLTFGGVRGRAEVTLNDCRLGETVGAAGERFEVLALLQDRNELVVDVTHDASLDQPGGLFGEVRLEIHPH